MSSSDDICQTTGRYSAYSPCGHTDVRWVVEGSRFPRCLVCDHVVAWTLLRETDRWGDYDYEWEVPVSKYRGMTINERLFDAKLMEQFDIASHDHDRDQMVLILLQVGLTLPAAERTADSVLANRTKRS